MSRVRSRGNAATELRLVGILREHRLSGWRRHQNVFGKPDFVFRSDRVAVFVDGCFWHSCPVHGSLPTTNRGFWQHKLGRNKSRDKLVGARLRDEGWSVLRIWQHELVDPQAVAERIRRVLSRAIQ